MKVLVPYHQFDTYFISDCSLVGSLNKIPISIAGIIIFSVPVSLPNFFSILFGESTSITICCCCRYQKNNFIYTISGLFAGILFARAKMSWCQNRIAYTVEETISNAWSWHSFHIRNKNWRVKVAHRWVLDDRNNLVIFFPAKKQPLSKNREMGKFPLEIAKQKNKTKNQISFPQSEIQKREAASAITSFEYTSSEKVTTDKAVFPFYFYWVIKPHLVFLSQLVTSYEIHIHYIFFMSISHLTFVSVTFSPIFCWWHCIYNCAIIF